MNTLVNVVICLAVGSVLMLILMGGAMGGL